MNISWSEEGPVQRPLRRRRARVGAVREGRRQPRHGAEQRRERLRFLHASLVRPAVDVPLGLQFGVSSHLRQAGEFSE